MDPSAEDPELKLSFDPSTIEHLGFKMYSRLPNAVAELVANSYDADATYVSVQVDTSDSQSVQVADDGHGMSPDDLALKYLRIGRNRRHDDAGLSESGRRQVAGRKGLGKLALFGIGGKITVRTKRKGAADWKVVTMTWDGLRGASGGDYRPEHHTEPASNPNEHGTTILVEDLKRKTAVDAQDLAASLAHLFNHIEDGFAVEVRANDEPPIAVSRELRYESIDVESQWDLPDGVKVTGLAPAIKGRIIAARKPLRQDLRGITVYVKGRLANDPEFFGVPESSYAYSYITGYVEADYLDNNTDEDVVATDRRSINWESSAPSALRDYLASVLREVAVLRRETRRSANTEALKNDLGVDVEKWTRSIEDPKSAQSVRDVLEVATSPDTQLSEGNRELLVAGLRNIAPEYADLHWRSLHPTVREAAESLYKSGNYFNAAFEAIKRYVKDVQVAGSLEVDELSAIGKAFAASGDNAPIVDVATPFLAKITAKTTRNIRSAQQTISQGLWQGFRDPIAHEVIAEMQEAGVFSYQDCLDALSILSHLYRRLEGATSGPDVA